jgi:hypothetical protein
MFEAMGLYGEPKGFSSPTTKQYYRTQQEHLAGLAEYRQRIQQAIDVIPQVLRGEARYTPGEVQLSTAIGARRESEEATIAAQVVDHIRASASGSDFLRALDNGTVRVIGELQAEKREYTFKLVDARGNVLQTFKDVYNPVAQTMSLGGMDNLNWQNAFNAPAPTQK